LKSADWKKRKDSSKWKDAAGYGDTKKGHIDCRITRQVWYKIFSFILYEVVDSVVVSTITASVRLFVIFGV